jgi:hypothetical protein
MMQEDAIPSSSVIAHVMLTLPAEAAEVLPDPDFRSNASLLEFVEGRQIHQTVASLDPLIGFSRDCIHQKNKLAKT